MTWDARFLALAAHVAEWSRDPSTQCGAVIADGKRIVSVGFNGFAAGVNDNAERYANRETKYALIVHAEINAVIFAGRPLKGCTLYTWPFQPCSRCAGVVVQSEISRVVAPPLPRALLPRWGDDTARAALQFAESGVTLEILGVAPRSPL